MTVHLIKLCVGVDTVAELAEWQAERLKRLAREKKKVEHCHRTLQMPRRRDEVLDGGSLYWVIKGFVLVRQRVLDLRPDVKDDGNACCGIVLDAELVATRAASAPRLPRVALSGSGRRARRTPTASLSLPTTCRGPCAKISASFVLLTGSGLVGGTATLSISRVLPR